jgi:acetolactate synthase-1/2/3 large subunit
MGFAASAVPVARLVYPERPAIAICGDGSFQMITNVLPVAAEYNLPVTWCVLDDQCLGSIKGMQETISPGPPFEVSFRVQPDFPLIARACGCYGEKIEEPDQIKSALNRAMDANKKGIPAVLDFIVRGHGPEAAYEYFSTF